MRYKIAFGDTRFKLEKEVRENIRNGFVPQGGVSVTIGTVHDWFYQAMVKPQAE